MIAIIIIMILHFWRLVYNGDDFFYIRFLLPLCFSQSWKSGCVFISRVTSTIIFNPTLKSWMLEKIWDFFLLDLRDRGSCLYYGNPNFIRTFSDGHTIGHRSVKNIRSLVCDEIAINVDESNVN